MTRGVSIGLDPQIIDLDEGDLIRDLPAKTRTLNPFGLWRGVFRRGWELTVVDTQSRETQQSTNPLGNAAPAVTDTAAFATCP